MQMFHFLCERRKKVETFVTCDMCVYGLVNLALINVGYKQQKIAYFTRPMQNTQHLCNYQLEQSLAATLKYFVEKLGDLCVNSIYIFSPSSSLSHTLI